MMKLILPRTHIPEKEIVGPLIFTAGPIQGGDDWQRHCCELLMELAPKPFTVACPCRWKTDHRLYPYRSKGREDRYERQLPWERNYLELASKKGCILFWAPNESKTKPRTSGPYAIGTRDELGEWRGRLIYDPSIKLAIGIEESFPYRDQISYNFQAASDRFPIFASLEDTVRAAIELSF